MRIFRKLSHDMRFPTMWYVGPAKPQISLRYSLEISMSVKLLTEHYLEFQSLKLGRTDASESTLVKMPHCWKSYVATHMYIYPLKYKKKYTRNQRLITRT